MIEQIRDVIFYGYCLRKNSFTSPQKAGWKIYKREQKKFAQSIGYDSGDIVSMWINGSSTSYNGKLHEISAKYGVSVEWLRGETDEKEKPALKESELDSELINRLCQLSKEELEKVDAFVQGVLASR